MYSCTIKCIIIIIKFLSLFTYKLSVFLLQILRELPREIADCVDPLRALGVAAWVDQVLDLSTRLRVDPEAGPVSGRLGLIKAEFTSLGVWGRGERERDGGRQREKGGGGGGGREKNGYTSSRGYNNYCLHRVNW